MTILLATIAGVGALAAAGFLPVLAAVGLRWCTVPLTPLAGAVVASLAATASLSFGGSLLEWFVGLAALAGLVVLTVLVVRPDLGLRPRPGGRRRGVPDRVAGVAGFVLVVATVIWSIRGLRTPTVGFDARALWVMRPGWFLQSHSQLLVDMRTRNLLLTQSAYPPLLSASAAVAWRITGIHTARLGVTMAAVLNACALAAAALAVVDAARSAARKVASPWSVLVIGVAASVLLVVISAGVTEPFLTNGYADPLWTLAAVGAVAYGLQLPDEPWARAAAVVLVLVAGMTKDEGFVTALALVVLLAARGVGRAGFRGARDRWVVPVVVAGGELVALAWWPLLMKVIHARADTSFFGWSDQIGSRAVATFHGMSPYLHVIVLAGPVAVAGGVVLPEVRRRVGIGNDLWAWLALVCGLAALGGALVTGTAAILPWIQTTVHRITEYPALQAWWILAMWAVVSAAALGSAHVPPPETASGGDPGTPVGDPETSYVGGPAPAPDGHR